MSTEELECQPELLAEEWGARLSTARESLAMSVDQVAKDLNLPPEYIETLEQGSLDGLPSMVFARGYIRAYAKLLNLADDELVFEFEQLHNEPSVKKGQIRPVSRVREQVKMNDPVMKLSSWVFVFAIVGASVWWWQTQYGGSIQLPSLDSSSPLSAEGDENAAVTPEPVVLENGTAQLQLPKIEDSEASSGIEEVKPAVEVEEAEPQYLSENEIKKLQQALDNETATVSEANTPTETVAAVVANDRPAQTPVAISELNIRANFVDECWVTIKDVNGKTLFNNKRGKGQSLNVTGKPPLNVLIGAASAVGSFSVNGAELDLAEHARRNIVRFSLPLSE